VCPRVNLFQVEVDSEFGQPLVAGAGGDCTSAALGSHTLQPWLWCLSREDFSESVLSPGGDPGFLGIKGLPNESNQKSWLFETVG
jgi:hypothetical protein